MIAQNLENGEKTYRKSGNGAGGLNKKHTQPISIIGFKDFSGSAPGRADNVFVENVSVRY